MTGLEINDDHSGCKVELSCGWFRQSLILWVKVVGTSQGILAVTEVRNHEGVGNGMERAGRWEGVLGSKSIATGLAK